MLYRRVLGGRLGGSPHDPRRQVSPAGVSSDGTHVWVANYAENTVSEIEASSGTVIHTIPVGSFPTGVSSDGVHVWVANYTENTVSEIEASSGTVIRTIPVGSLPIGVSSDGVHVWVTNWGEGTVSEIEASSGTVIHTIPVAGATSVSSDGTACLGHPAAMNPVSEIEAASGYCDQDDQSWHGAPRRVFRRNPRLGHEPPTKIRSVRSKRRAATVIHTIPVGVATLYGMSSDGTHVWVNEPRAKIPSVRSKRRAAPSSARSPVGLAPLPQCLRMGAHVWVANYTENTVSEILANGAKCAGTAGRWCSHGSDRHSVSPDDQGQGNPGGLRARTAHGSKIHREVENSRSGVVLGAENSGRTSNRRRDI